ncbi:MAG: hypothetical protein EHM79_14005 [Geobacter sp.]|nr:MAG: hypothetical protein EHM79_14005 [Geobacter sp.]
MIVSIGMRETARLILFSLTPSFAGRFCPSDETKALIEYLQPNDSSAPSSPCQLFFASASPLAAPFLLFRLKRWGFSSCRVSVQQRGLLLTATR